MMKTIAPYLLSFGVLLASLCAAPFPEEISEFRVVYQGKGYFSAMPWSVLNASPDFDPANRTLPKSIKDIIEVAFTQLEKITGSKKGCTVDGISLRCSLQNQKKWFYAVSFQAPSFEEMVIITVTVDGRLGVVKEIEERPVE
jgi:hypothetical protein